MLIGGAHSIVVVGLLAPQLLAWWRSCIHQERNWLLSLMAAEKVKICTQDTILRHSCLTLLETDSQVSLQAADPSFFHLVLRKMIELDARVDDLHRQVGKLS